MLAMIEESQVYIVVDIEADGPVPGLFSMLSLGAVATTDEREISSFYQKILPLSGASQEPSTMAWWKTQPEAWAEVNSDAKPAHKVMSDFVEWLDGLGKKPMFVAHPVSFDYTFVSWYLWKFTGGNPFVNGFSAPVALDMSSFIAGKFGLSYSDSMRSNLPEWMRLGMPEHSHNALDDAKGFSVILRNVLTNSRLDQ